MRPLLPSSLVTVFELRMPLSSSRCDVLLCSSDRRGLVLDLKGWRDADVRPGPDPESVLLRGECHVHPSVQAAGYAGYLGLMHQAFFSEEEKELIKAAAFLPNLQDSNHAALNRSEALAETPLFGRGDQGRLCDLASTSLTKGAPDESFVTQLREGRYKPSRRLLARVAEVIHAEPQWKLVDEQLEARNAILHAIRTVPAREKAIILVRGGRGPANRSLRCRSWANSPVRRRT